MDYHKYVDKNQVEHLRKAIPRRIIDQLTWKRLLRLHGDEELQVKSYGKEGQRSLYAEDLDYMSLRSYYNTHDDYLAVKHSFDTTTAYPLLQYILKSIAQKIPLSDPTLGEASFTLRISPRSWAFPKHFDGVANFMILLNGTRDVEVSYKNEPEVESYHLRPGDIFYIPPLWSHYFTATNAEPAIVLNVAFRTEAGDLEFKAAYPRRVDEIVRRI